MRFLLLSLAVLSFSLSFADERPRVAVVLAGGGAKGAAHIGALKVIEEAGVPVDIIVGTSMGSIVGGLYAIGYTPHQMDSIFLSQDWTTLLSDKASRDELNLQSWENSSQYILTFPFFKKPQEIIGGGIIKGRNIGRMLWQYTEGWHDSIDFNRMPIPFACVSQDLVTGEEIVFHSGVLPLAIRASMSIPGVFAPVQDGDKLLIDGGMVNNYPVDVARNMGADIVIGVDVQDSLKSADDLQQNILVQLTQLIDLQSNERWEQNKAATDIYIKADISGYNTSNFYTEALDTLIRRGEAAARAHLDELYAVADSCNRKKLPVVPFFLLGATQPTNSSQAKSLNTLVGDNPLNSINLGLRFDNEDLAGLLFNCSMQVGAKKNHFLDFTLRLGKQVYGDVHYGYELTRSWQVIAGYHYTYNDFNIYEKGDRAYSVNFNHQLAEAGFYKSWKKMSLKIGAICQLYNYGTFLYNFSDARKYDVDRENYLKLGGQYSVNTCDDAYFPVRGSEFGAEYYYAVPNRHKTTFHTAAAHWQCAISFNTHFTLMPRVAARYVSEENTVSEMNSIGGQEWGKYFVQQIPFYGLDHIEMANRALVVLGIEGRQRICKKHYVSLAFNLAATADEWGRFFKQSFQGDDTDGYYAIGGAIRYDMRTYIGPVGFTLSYSDRGKMGAYVRAGFNF